MKAQIALLFLSCSTCSQVFAPCNLNREGLIKCSRSYACYSWSVGGHFSLVNRTQSVSHTWIIKLLSRWPTSWVYECMIAWTLLLNCSWCTVELYKHFQIFKNTRNIVLPICTFLMSLEIPACLCNLTMYSGTFTRQYNKKKRL